MADITGYHILIKEVDEQYTRAFSNPRNKIYYRYRLECPGPEFCQGISECMDDHVVDGRDAHWGPWECEEDDPWADEEEFEFHGEVHTWTDEYRWTVPCKGCWIHLEDQEPDDLLLDQPVGRYVVELEWDWDEYILKPLGPEAEVLARDTV
jgi:hypothetical protein